MSIYEFLVRKFAIELDLIDVLLIGEVFLGEFRILLGLVRGVPAFEVVHIIITGPRFAAVVVLLHVLLTILLVLLPIIHYVGLLLLLN